MFVFWAVFFFFFTTDSIINNNNACSDNEMFTSLLGKDLYFFTHQKKIGPAH